MSHACYDGGGPCPACAEEAFLDRVEEETLYRLETLLKDAVKDLSDVLRLTEEEIREQLWDFVYNRTLKMEWEG